MLFALIGSVLYLLGTALIYGRVRHARHCPARRSGPPEPVAWTAAALMTIGVAGKDSALSVASVVAARPCRRAGARQRRAVGVGREGIIYPDRPDLVRRHARAFDFHGRPIARDIGRRGDSVWKRARAASSHA